MSRLKEIAVSGIVDGLAMSATTTAALMAASKLERGSAWAAINPICHMIDGDQREYGDAFDPKDSLRGIALSSSAMLAWGVIYQVLCGRIKWPTSNATGLATAAGAYLIDYHLVPKRFTPGIEKKISVKSIGAVYVVLGLTLGVMAKLRKSG